MSCECVTNCDCWAAKEFRRLRSDAQFWQGEHVRLVGRISMLETEIKLNEHRDRTDVAWLQGKVVAQRKEIKRLNDSYNAERLQRGVEVVPDVQPDHAVKTEVVSRQYAVTDAGRSKPVVDVELPDSAGSSVSRGDTEK
jgi:hypothetical protein